MKSLGRKAFVASFAVLVLLAGLCTALAIELRHWHDATQYVMRDYRRALLDGEFQEALTRAMAEKANYQLTGDSHFETEAREAIERAEQVTKESRALAQQRPEAPGDSYHVRFLDRQEILLTRTKRALADVDRQMAATGIANAIEPLQGVFSTEIEADELRQETMAHHRAERAENEEELRMHGYRALVLVIATVAVSAIWTILMVFYVQQRIVAPITELSDLTSRVAAGDLSHSASVTHSDEIGRLQLSFNQMVVEVAQKQRELEASREHLARSRDAAEAANQAKSEFLANVSHELRTPMNGVIVTLDLMRETAQDPEQRDLAELARTSALGLLGMLNDLLDLSRIEAGKLELESVPFEPRQMVRQMVELHGKRASAKGIEVTCDIAEDVPARLTGDPVRVGQVLLNLLDNAIKFTERGSIHVKVALDGPQPLPAHRQDGESDPTVGLRFEVADTGIGIPCDAAPRLFQPFYQVEGTGGVKYGGIGLGLGIARQLARMMH
ncbi:MAG TPA: histidine kinase dimerization/phospho-acceptor domain-containing protein, partial [Albitalea sp.]